MFQEHFTNVVKVVLEERWKSAERLGESAGIALTSSNF